MIFAVKRPSDFNSMSSGRLRDSISFVDGNGWDGEQRSPRVANNEIVPTAKAHKNEVWKQMRNSISGLHGIYLIFGEKD